MRIELRESGSVDHELIWSLVALSVLIAAAALPMDQMLQVAGYRCPFRALTGLPCPTCRGVRTLVAMGSLDVAAGFRLNPLVAAGWCGAVLFVPYALFVSLTGRRRVRIVEIKLLERRAVKAGFALLVALNWAYLILSA